MRQPITFLFACLAFAGCSKIPGCSTSSGIQRVSEKLDVPCDTKQGRRPRDNCVTEEIACGDRIVGNTAGGKNNFEGDFYRSKYCIPFDNDYSGTERVYLLKMPSQTVADVWLDGNCEDLDLFAMRWSYEGKCPTTAHLIGECEGDDAKKGGHVRLVTTTHEGEYLVSVDGKAGITGAFGLVVDCLHR